MSVAAVLWSGVIAHAGSARDYLNAPVDTCGADMGLNYERVVAKPAREPYSQTVRLTVRQLW